MKERGSSVRAPANTDISQASSQAITANLKRLTRASVSVYFTIRWQNSGSCFPWPYPIPVVVLGLDAHKAIYNEFGEQIFGGGTYDESCSNANRLFYYPSKPVGCSVDHLIEYINAPLLEWRPVWTKVVAFGHGRTEHARPRNLVRWNAMMRRFRISRISSITFRRRLRGRSGSRR